MQLTKKPPAFPGSSGKFPRILYILVFVCVYLIGFTVTSPRASAATLSAPGGNISDPVVRQVDIARPAVVRIITSIGGRLTVRFSANTQPVTFPVNGSSYTMRFSGSGAFISAHGDILTADHVVNPPHDQSLDDALYEYAAQDVADYFNSHFQTTSGQQYSASDMQAFLTNGSLPSTTAYDTPSSQVYLSTSYAGPISGSKLANVPAGDQAAVDRIEAQSSFEQADVAIIHVSGMDNMPAIPLGDSSQVAEQDNLTIIGFPGLGDVSTLPTNVFTSSINKIYVSAIKTTDNGTPVIQVGGNVEHGDSGAPALDSNGNVVGIVSFGLSDPSGTGETTFLQASNSARALIQSLGINTTPGSFENAWVQAFNDYSSPTSGHWQKAAQELQNLAGTYKGFVGVTPYLKYAQNQAAHEQSPASGSGPSTTLLVVLLLLLVLLLGVALIFIIVKRSARPVLAGPGSQYAATPYGAYPQQPQQGMPGAYPPPGAASGIQPAPASYAASVYPPTPASYAQSESVIGHVPQTPPVSVNGNAQPEPQEQEPVLAHNSSFALPQAQTPFPAEQVYSTATWTPSQAQTPAALAQSVRERARQRALESGAPSEQKQEHALSQSDQPGASSPAYDATLRAGTIPPPLPASASWPTFSTLEMENAQTTKDDEKTLEEQTFSRTFSVPRRPSSTSGTLPEAAAPSSTADQQIRLAPCGHANAPDVLFCRACGQPTSFGQPSSPAGEAQ